MSEVNGFLILKLPAVVLDKIECESEYLSSIAIAEIIEIAGIREPVDEKLVLLGLDLVCDGKEITSDLLFIHPFDEHFMDLAKLLAEHGSGIEVYGAIGHEHGGGGFYLLDAEGNRHVALFDSESVEAKPCEEAFEQFRNQIPDRIKQTFDDIFD